MKNNYSRSRVAPFKKREDVHPIVKFFAKAVFLSVLCVSYINFTYSQCTNDVWGNYSNLSPTCGSGANGGWATSFTDCYPGEYSLVNVIAGSTYEFQTYRSNSPTFTGRYATIATTANVPIVWGNTSSTTSITWTATFSGQVRFYTHLSNACGTSTQNSTRRVRCSTPVVSCTPPALAGFGNNVWNVECYDGNNFNTYKGFYTENNLNFNSTTRWGVTGTPSSANASSGAAYTGCPIPNDNHSFVYKRQGFPAGTYTINIDRNDDYILLINGVQVSTGGCCGWSNGVWTGTLNASSTIEARFREYGGDSRGLITFLTDPCNTMVAMTCGTTYNANLGTQGSWSSYTGCGWNEPGGEQVYSFTPTVTGNHTFNAVTNSGDPDFFLMSSCGTSGTNVYGSCWGEGSISVNLVAGTTYYVIADNYSSSNTASFNLVVNCPTPPPANDNCANAQSITIQCPASATAVSGTTANATEEAMADPSCDPGTIRDVWYTFNSGPNTSVDLTLTLGTASWIGGEVHTTCGSPAPGLTIGGNAGNCDFYLLNPSPTVISGLVPNTTYRLRLFTNIDYDVAGSFTFTLTTSVNNPGAVSVPASICAGTATSITNVTAATGGPNNVNYYFYYRGGPSNVGWQMYDGPTTNTSSSLPAAVINTPGTWFIARNSDFGCGQANNATTLDLQLIVNAASTAPALSGTSPVCPSTSVTINATGGVASPGSTINWYTGPNGTGTFLGTGSSYTVTPASTTTYYARREGGCNTTSDGTYTITVNNPTLATAPANGDMVWRGASSNDWATIGNWWQYNGSAYTAATAAPTTAQNVVIPVNQACVLNSPNTNANSGNANSLRIENGATLTMGSGNLNVAGNWVNNGSFVPGTGTVTFAGSGTHSISGSSANHNFNNLTMNKTGEIILSVPAILSGSLTLTNGRLNIGNFNLDLPTNTINGGNANSYVKTTGTGVLMRNVGASTVDFPVGRGAYNPAALTNSGTSDKFSVRVIDNVTDNGDNADTDATTSMAVVNRTWMIDEQNAGGSNITLRLNWNGAGEEINGFQGINAFIAHYMTADGLWDNIGGTTPSLNVIETGGITSFSPFTISSDTEFAPLPVELMSFSSTCENEDVAILWTTASENNSMHFEVEVSKDALNWEVLSIVQAAQFSTSMIDYAIKHEGGAREKNYYRLKQVDQNGDFKVYNVIYADCGSSTGTPSTFPNPSRNDFAIDMNGVDMKGAVQMIVLNSEGKEISSRQLDLGEGVAVLQITNMDLQPGVYYLKMIDETGRSFIIKHCFM